MDGWCAHLVGEADEAALRLLIPAGGPTPTDTGADSAPAVADAAAAAAVVHGAAPRVGGAGRRRQAVQLRGKRLREAWKSQGRFESSCRIPGRREQRTSPPVDPLLGIRAYPPPDGGVEGGESAGAWVAFVTCRPMPSRRLSVRILRGERRGG